MESLSYPQIIGELQKNKFSIAEVLAQLSNSTIKNEKCLFCLWSFVYDHQEGKNAFFLAMKNEAVSFNVSMMILSKKFVKSADVGEIVRFMTETSSFIRGALLKQLRSHRRTDVVDVLLQNNQLNLSNEQLSGIFHLASPAVVLDLLKKFERQNLDWKNLFQYHSVSCLHHFESILEAQKWFDRSGYWKFIVSLVTDRSLNVFHSSKLCASLLALYIKYPPCVGRNSSIGRSENVEDFFLLLDLVPLMANIVTGVHASVLLQMVQEAPLNQPGIHTPLTQAIVTHLITRADNIVAGKKTDMKHQDALVLLSLVTNNVDLSIANQSANVMFCDHAALYKKLWLELFHYFMKHSSWIHTADIGRLLLPKMQDIADHYMSMLVKNIEVSDDAVILQNHMFTVIADTMMPTLSRFFNHVLRSLETQFRYVEKAIIREKSKANLYVGLAKDIRGSFDFLSSFITGLLDRHDVVLSDFKPKYYKIVNDAMAILLKGAQFLKPLINDWVHDGCNITAAATPSISHFVSEVKSILAFPVFDKFLCLWGPIMLNFLPLSADHLKMFTYFESAIFKLCPTAQLNEWLDLVPFETCKKFINDIFVFVDSLAFYKYSAEHKCHFKASFKEHLITINSLLANVVTRFTLRGENIYQFYQFKNIYRCVQSSNDLPRKLAEITDKDLACTLKDFIGDFKALPLYGNISFSQFLEPDHAVVLAARFAKCLQANDRTLGDVKGRLSSIASMCKTKNLYPFLCQFFKLIADQSSELQQTDPHVLMFLAEDWDKSMHMVSERESSFDTCIFPHLPLSDSRVLRYAGRKCKTLGSFALKQQVYELLYMMAFEQSCYSRHAYDHVPKVVKWVKLPTVRVQWTSKKLDHPLFNKFDWSYVASSQNFYLEKSGDAGSNAAIIALLGGIIEDVRSADPAQELSFVTSLLNFPLVRACMLDLLKLYALRYVHEKASLTFTRCDDCIEICHQWLNFVYKAHFDAYCRVNGEEKGLRDFELHFTAAFNTLENYIRNGQDHVLFWLHQNSGKNEGGMKRRNALKHHIFTKFQDFYFSFISQNVTNLKISKSSAATSLFSIDVAVNFLECSQSLGIVTREMIDVLGLFVDHLNELKDNGKRANLDRALHKFLSLTLNGVGQRYDIKEAFYSEIPQTLTADMTDLDYEFLELYEDSLRSFAGDMKVFPVMKCFFLRRLIAQKNVPVRSTVAILDECCLLGLNMCPSFVRCYDMLPILLTRLPCETCTVICTHFDDMESQMYKSGLFARDTNDHIMIPFIKRNVPLFSEEGRTTLLGVLTSMVKDSNFGIRYRKNAALILSRKGFLSAAEIWSLFRELTTVEDEAESKKTSTSATPASTVDSTIVGALLQCITNMPDDIDYFLPLIFEESFMSNASFGVMALNQLLLLSDKIGSSFVRKLGKYLDPQLPIYKGLNIAAFKTIVRISHCVATTLPESIDYLLLFWRNRAKLHADIAMYILKAILETIASSSTIKETFFEAVEEFINSISDSNAFTVDAVCLIGRVRPQQSLLVSEWVHTCSRQSGWDTTGGIDIAHADVSSQFLQRITIPLVKVQLEKSLGLTSLKFWFGQMDSSNDGLIGNTLFELIDTANITCGFGKVNDVESDVRDCVKLLATMDKFYHNLSMYSKKHTDRMKSVLVALMNDANSDALAYAVKYSNLQKAKHILSEFTFKSTDLTPFLPEDLYGVIKYHDTAKQVFQKVSMIMQNDHY